MNTEESINIKLITTGYNKDEEVITLLTDIGMLNLSKAAAERLRNHLAEFLGPAGKDDLLLQAKENGGVYYSPETGVVNTKTNKPFLIAIQGGNED